MEEHNCSNIKSRLQSYSHVAESQVISIMRDIKEAAAEVTQGRRSKRNPPAQVLAQQVTEAPLLYSHVQA
jgi:hypothetical protein